MESSSLTPKQRHRWILVILGIGAGLNIVVRSVSSSDIGNLIGSVAGIACLLSVAWLIGLGPFRKVQRPESRQVEAVQELASPGEETPIQELERLAQRWRAGEIGEAEFESEKRRILSR